MRLLIIEDNVELSQIMKLELEGFGFSVDVANNGEDGEEKAYINEYDIILLDLILPDREGINILKYLRKCGINTPVIIVSARMDINERINSLDLGADDYILKPFDIIELRSRIQSILRRYNGRANTEVVIKYLKINPLARKVNIKEKEVSLSSKEFDILEYIAINYPTVVSSEKIQEHVYDENFNPFSSVLRVHIAKLRKKLRNACGKNILSTIKGKGYYLNI